MTQVKLGDKNIPFIYQGNELLYPNPIKDGLVLWYDFKGMRNSDVSKNVVKDLSGNGNNGTLENFNYTNGSGYSEKGLKFDGVDDLLSISKSIYFQTIELSLNISQEVSTNKIIFQGDNLYDYFYMSSYYNFVISNRSKYNGKNQVKPITNNVEKDFTKINHLVVTLDEFKFEVFVNGISIGEEEYPEESIPFNLYNVFNYNKTKLLDDNLKSVKVYNKRLSAKEVEHNYQLEKERWGL